MRKSGLLALASAIGLFGGPLAAQQSIQREARPAIVAPRVPNEGALSAVAGKADGAAPAAQQMPAALQLANNAMYTGLHGFYDYQSNGALHGRIVVDNNDPRKIYVVYMLSTTGDDSVTIQTTRRVGYAYSTDGGGTWQSTNEIQPGFRLGYPYLAVTDAGVPYIVCHGDPDGQGVRSLVYTGAAGSTTFTRTGTFERVSFTGRTGDQGAGVIWPAIAIAPDDATKQVVIATLSNPTGEDPEPIHFGRSALGTSTAWELTSQEDNSLTSGGRHLITRSKNGKLGIVFYHFDTQGGTGVYLTESTNGGQAWSLPVKVLNNNVLSDGDTVSLDANIDMAYNGEEPNVVATGYSRNDSTFAFKRNAVFHWSPQSGAKRIIMADSIRGIGVNTVFARQGTRALIKTQPLMGNLAYPTLSVGDDGRHMVVVFSATAQFGATDENAAVSVVSEDQFSYYRLWAVGSPDGGRTWSDANARVLQNFASESGDSATIEYPVANPTGKVADNTFEHSMVFQAKRFPGMYSTVDNDVDPDLAGDQPADRGQINEAFLYFQRTTLDPTFFGQPAAVPSDRNDAAGATALRTFPNPANTLCTVRYTLPTMGLATLHVYNMLGQEVLSRTDLPSYPGEYAVPVDVSGLSGGGYRVVVAQNGHNVSAPFTVVR